jgi:hypothetical protein
MTTTSNRAGSVLIEYSPRVHSSFHIQAWSEQRPQMELRSCAASASSTAITIISDNAS